MLDQSFAGVFAPLVTVFDRDERICLDAIARNVKKYNDTGLKGYMPLGSNGEFQGLQDDEALAVLDTVASNKARDKVIVGGCGRESVGKTVTFIRQAADHGLDYAFILPPFYFAKQLQTQGLIRYYQSVADSSPVPLVIYNAPKFSAGISLSPSTVAQLANHPNILALKNSSQTPNSCYIKATAGCNFSLIAGNIGTFYSGLQDGAIGGVLSTASYLPEYCCLLYQLFSTRQTERAGQLSLDLQQLSQAGAGPLGVAGVKAAMDVRGLEGGYLRLPLLPLSEAQLHALKAALDAAHIPAFPADLS